MKILSLFDGISCGQVALERAGIVVDDYFASEIKPLAIKVTQSHFPNTIQLGDISKVSYNNGILFSENGAYFVDKIHLLIGGSPCQDFSGLKSLCGQETNGYHGEKSKLFFEYFRLLKEINPNYFLLENVKMKKEYEETISSLLRYTPNRINSSLVSFQTRDRLYWTNINNGFIPLPADKNVSFQNNIDGDISNLKEAKMNNTPSRVRMWSDGNGGKLGSCKNITKSNKIGCLTRKQDRCPNSGLISYDGFARFLTRTEMEAAQTLPFGYLKDCSHGQVSDLTGDGWTVDVVAHIFSFLPDKYKEVKK